MVLQDRYDQIIRIPYFWSLLDLVYIYIYIVEKTDKKNLFSIVLRWISVVETCPFSYHLSRQ
jgi:hypothetical protein